MAAGSVSACSFEPRSALPGFGLTMGYTLVYLSLSVLIPLATLAVSTAGLSAGELWELATSPRALAAYTIAFGASLIAALVDVVLGTLLAWAIVRHRFRGRSVIDAIVDLPFALPTAVCGLALASVLAPIGGFAPLLAPLGSTLALVVVGLPFVVRTVQPVLEALEETAAGPGAPRRQTPGRVRLPALAPAVLAGFALAFARAIGEYGAVVFIAGTRLEADDAHGATALALVLLVVSLSMLLAISSLGAWTRRRAGRR